MFLVSDCTTGDLTLCVVVECEQELATAIERFRLHPRATGGDPKGVTVNPLGRPGGS